MSLDFIERDENGAAHIKINVTPEVRAAAERVVNVHQDLLQTQKIPGSRTYHREYGRLAMDMLGDVERECSDAIANLRGAVRKDNPELPSAAFGINPLNDKGQYMPKHTHHLRRDIKLAVNDTLNGLLKEIADAKGVEAPVLNTVAEGRSA